jgi:hypothetical protein
MHKNSGVIFILSLSLILLICGHDASSQDQLSLPLAQFPDGLPFEIDSNPCGKVVPTKNMEFLQDNMIAYYPYEIGEIKSVKVRLTCDYKEAEMPQDDSPSMSKKTYQLLLKILNGKRRFGKMVTDRMVAPVNGHVITRICVYQNARITWDERSCTKPKRNYGCGIRRVDVFYENSTNSKNRVSGQVGSN